MKTMGKGHPSWGKSLAGRTNSLLSPLATYSCLLPGIYLDAVFTLFFQETNQDALALIQIEENVSF